MGLMETCDPGCRGIVAGRVAIPNRIWPGGFLLPGFSTLAPGLATPPTHTNAIDGKVRHLTEHRFLSFHYHS